MKLNRVAAMWTSKLATKVEPRLRLMYTSAPYAAALCTSAGTGDHVPRHLAPFGQRRTIPRPRHPGEVRDQSRGDAVVAVHQPVRQLVPRRGHAEVRQQVVVDHRRHPGQIARLLLLADPCRRPLPADLLEDEG